MSRQRPDLLLKRPEHLSEKQELKLADPLKVNLRTARSYLLKGDLSGFLARSEALCALKAVPVPREVLHLTFFCTSSGAKG